MLTTLSIICLILLAFYIFNKNKQANPNLLSNPPSTSTLLKFEFDANSIYKSILNFGQTSDYKISLLNETNLEVILNYTPKMGEQTNGTFFPIWVKATSNGSCEVTVGAKDKSLALKFEETSALNKLVNNLKAHLLSNSARNQFNPSDDIYPQGEFNGERSLVNDSYRIFLVKKYRIEKNSVLDGFVIGDKLFSTLDEVLLFATKNEDDFISAKLIAEASLKNEKEKQLGELNEDSTISSNKWLSICPVCKSSIEKNATGCIVCGFSFKDL